MGRGRTDGSLDLRPAPGQRGITRAAPPCSEKSGGTYGANAPSLESPVVILAGLDEEVYPDFTTAAYVGMSRARTRLVILAPETLPDALRRDLEG